MKTLFIALNLILITIFSAHGAEIAQPKKLFISWEKFHADTNILAEKLKDQGPFKGIVAIARGGFVPAVIIAHKLGIKKVVTFSLSSYSNTGKQTDFKLHHTFKDKKERWLVIDDLVDSGKTVEKIRSYLPESVFAVVYAKPKGEKMADFYSQKTQQDTWIVFPWEM